MTPSGWPTRSRQPGLSGMAGGSIPIPVPGPARTASGSRGAGQAGSDPQGWTRKADARLLATLRVLLLDRIPRDPLAAEFRQGNTLERERRHWFRAKFSGNRFRLFFPADSRAKVIVYAWVMVQSGPATSHDQRVNMCLRTQNVRGNLVSDTRGRRRMPTMIRTAVIAILLAFSPFAHAWSAEGSLRETNPSDGKLWWGPLTNIQLVGPDTWSAHWHNSQNEDRDITITLIENRRKVDIWEQQSNQHWVAPINLRGTICYVKGKDTTGKYDFTAVLPIGKPYRKKA